MNGIPFVMNFNLIVASQKGAGCLAVRGWVWFSRGGHQHSWKKPGSRLFWGEILEKNYNVLKKIACHCMGECVLTAAATKIRVKKVVTNLIFKREMIFIWFITDRSALNGIRQTCFKAWQELQTLQDVDLEIWNESMKEILANQETYIWRKHFFPTLFEVAVGPTWNCQHSSS